MKELFKNRYLRISMLVHLGIGSCFALLERERLPETRKIVNVNIVEKETVAQINELDEAKRKKVPPRPKKVKPKEEKKQVSRTAKKPTKKKKILGVTNQSLAKDGGAVSAPIGNTLNEIDRGIRLNKDDTPTESDLSRDARLIRSTLIKPIYTDEATDVSLEGNYRVAVFVDESGTVLDVELDEVIGYGMDERVLLASQSARFIPRLDRTGRKVSGWTYIIFKLRLE